MKKCQLRKKQNNHTQILLAKGELDLQVRSGVLHTETLEKVQSAHLAGTPFLQRHMQNGFCFTW